MSEKVTFAPNIPQTLSLLYSEGRNIENGGLMFTLSDQRVVFLDPDVAESLVSLRLQPGETFGICKRWNGLRGRASDLNWDIWLTPETEKSRAKAEEPDLTIALQRSIEAVQTRKSGGVVRMPAPAFELQPTGTCGPNPVALAAPVPASIPRKPPTVGRIPFNVAFTETVKFVKDGLEAAGEQWNDEARQAIASTVLIAAAKQGWLTVWEREDCA